MNLALILQAIIALPKIISVISSFIKAIQVAQEHAKESHLAEAILEAEKAKTKEEVKKANEAITGNLP
jgi:hypothetical protein